MTTLLKDVIRIAERAGAEDYVLRLTDSVGAGAAKDTLDHYVVTRALAESFDAALGLVAESIASHTSRGAFLTGSFGSGKSHFMAVLHALLRHEPAARDKAELQAVIATHDPTLRERKILPLAFHLLDSESLEQALFSGYLRQIQALHPNAPLPALHRSDELLADAEKLRASMGDEGFFASLNGDAGEDAWSGFLGGGTWDAARYHQARAGAPGTELRQQLVTALVEEFYSAFVRGAQFVDLDSGLAAMAAHAKSLGYDAVVLFLDELVLWLAFLVQDREKFSRESQKITKLVESSSGQRAVPLVSFIARQIDLRKWFADSGANGREQELLEGAFRHQEGRFASIALGDDNLPYVANKRLLQPRDAAGGRVLADAFGRLERRPEVWDVLLDGMNTDEEHRGSNEAAFRLTYPFSPALMSTLRSLASVMQRERTALKVMQQMLVDRRETLTVDDVIPVGDAFDHIVQGQSGQALDTQAAALFRSANALYVEKVRPMLLAANALTAQSLDHPGSLPRGYRADDRLAKTLLLAAVAPKVPALKDVTAARLASLNHGSIVSPLPGAEAQMVLTKVRSWAQKVPEIHVDGDTKSAVIRVQLADVDYESVVEKAKGEDNEGRQRELVTQLVAESLGVPLGERDMLGVYQHHIIWRGSRRPVELVFGNVRDSGWLTEDHFRTTATDGWRLVIDHPFDTAGHSSAEDLQRLERLRATGLTSRTLVWLPHFLSAERMRDLRRLVILDWLLTGHGDRWASHADHLSEADRAQAFAILDTQRAALREAMLQTLQQAYGVAPAQPGVLLEAARTERVLTSLEPVLDPKEPAGVSLRLAFEGLLTRAFDATYPAHPMFEPADAEVRPAELKAVCANLNAAMADPERRVPIVGDHKAVRRVANALHVGYAAETHFVFGDDRFGTWGTDIERAMSG